MFFSRNGQVLVLEIFSIIYNFHFVFGSDKKDNAKAVAEAIVSSIKIPQIDVIASTMISSKSSCAKEIKAFSEAIDAEESWALEMIDASSKIQSGILQGNLVDFGMYEQCVRVDEKYNDLNILGKHCLVTFGFESLELTSSVCIPSSCNETQAAQIASLTMRNLLAKSSLHEKKVEPTKTTCARVGEEDFNTTEIITIIFFAAVGFFMVFCTMCDFAKRTWPEKTTSSVTVNILAKFSLYKNAATLFDTKVDPGAITCINGIRFLSTCWIVVLHQTATSLANPMVNSWDGSRWSLSGNSVWYQMSTFANDNFLLMGGFLNGYMFFKKMRTGLKFNLPTMYLHRYVRLTPCVAAVGLFAGVLYHRIGNGPWWTRLSPFVVKGCKENWWYNLLYIQNILPSQNICILQTWFLAVDMQLFFISPIILYPMYRWRKYGLYIWTLMTFASIIVSISVVGFNGYSINPDFSKDSFDHYENRPYTRAFPYLLGILLGYEIVMNQKRRLTQFALSFNWTMTCILIMFCYLSIHRLRNTDIEYNPVFEIACAASVRQCWSIALAWIIYACIQGYGGVLARFLSSPIFVPLSRLSYGIYLVHFMIIIQRTSTMRISGIIMDSELFNTYLGDLSRSIFASVVISLFFEMPVITLEKILKTREIKHAESMV